MILGSQQQMPTADLFTRVCLNQAVCPSQFPSLSIRSEVLRGVGAFRSWLRPVAAPVQQDSWYLGQLEASVQRLHCQCNDRKVLVRIGIFEGFRRWSWGKGDI